MVEALIWVAIIFLLGSFFALERRCLGQMAFVQPLVLCLVTGWLADQPELGIWLGVSLQLSSITPTRHSDWALSGMIAAATILTSHRLGIYIVPGDPKAYGTVLIAVFAGIASHRMDCKLAQLDGIKIQNNPPWKGQDPAHTVETLVRKFITRWFFIGGAQVTIGTGIATLALYIFNATYGPTEIPHPMWVVIMPVLGAVVAMNSLMEYRFLAWASISAALSLAVIL